MQPLKDRKNTWAMWFRAGKMYNAWWHTGQDFTHMSIQSHKYTDSDPAVMFKFNYTLFR